METLFIFLVKASGLIGIFYLAYILLLRKETFFNSNRWFLLAGLITSILLPLLVFTKIVWVESNPTTFDWSNIPMTTPTVENEGFEINWYLVLALVYSIGILGFLAKFALDFYSLSKVLKGKTIQQQADFKFIDVNENIAPFSYFNSIVYNSSLYSATELGNILEHEKVHSTQNHTADVLISRLFCIVFWFNPLMWLYKKAIVQNLEFIADSEASKNISDKKAYQLTLLKITTQENCVAITNHFYQSLIKKRIVMLNKNQSNKRNSWKYAVVLPLLGAFLFFFQVKVVAQEKESTKQEITSTEIPFFMVINETTSDKEIKEYSNILKSNYDVKLIFSKIKRNSNGEIIAIKAEFTTKDGRSGATEIEGTKPIKSFYFYIKGDDMGFEELKDLKNNGNVTVSKSPIASVMSVTSNDVKSIKITDKDIYIDGAKVSQEEFDKLDPNTIETMAVNKESGKSTIKIRTKKGSNIPDDTEIFVNGKKISKEEMDKLDTSSIESINVTKNGITPGNITIISRKTEINDIDQAKKAAEQAKIASEQAKKDTQQAKIDAEQAKWDAEKAKKDEEAKKRK
ncbi:peptidase M56 [Flavobacterium alvei]|uniref:Peptidase M56 n=1 Tax=Flavobacterium alvei TaxID=2080416 RepID=A0A2S5A2S6_9FLAO|nr:M56 family metallopeptidase [Flavobacterium alvei]POY36824.1 peptidase M56 [Flavobacterium alvei]